MDEKVEDAQKPARKKPGPKPRGDTDAPKPGRPSSRAEAARKEFSHRFGIAVDRCPGVPMAYGRYPFIASRISAQGKDEQVSPESVRKWLAGLSLPTDARMPAIARALGVDEEWLRSGVTSSDEQHERPSAPAGGVDRDILLALVRLGGGEITEMFETGAPAQFRATIKGVDYAFLGAIGQREGDGFIFELPAAAADKTFAIGIIPVGPFRFRLFELDWDAVAEVGELNDGVWSVKVSETLSTKKHNWREIMTFAKRP